MRCDGRPLCAGDRSSARHKRGRRLPGRCPGVGRETVSHGRGQIDGGAIGHLSCSCVTKMYLASIDLGTNNAMPSLISVMGRENGQIIMGLMRDEGAGMMLSRTTFGGSMRSALKMTPSSVPGTRGLASFIQCCPQKTCACRTVSRSRFSPIGTRWQPPVPGAGSTRCLRGSLWRGPR